MTNNCIVINLFGGPSSGKSTAMAGLFYMMKKHGRRVEMAHEYVKLAVYDGSIHNMSQYDILLAQHHTISTFHDSGLLEYVITDAPLLMSCIYGSGSVVCKQAKRLNSNFNNLNFFINRSGPFQKEGRIHNEEESVDIDKRIKMLLNDVNEPYIEVQASADIDKTLYGHIALKQLKSY